MTQSVIRSAEEIERLETIARMAEAMLADQRNQIISAYHFVLAPLLRGEK